MEIEPIDFEKYTPIYPRYRCEKCRFEWQSDRFGGVVCLRCYNHYVVWLNFRESLESIGKYETL